MRVVRVMALGSKVTSTPLWKSISTSALLLKLPFVHVKVFLPSTMPRADQLRVNSSPLSIKEAISAEYLDIQRFIL